MTIEEAIKTGIEYELEVRHVYSEAAKKFNLNLADGLAFFPNGGGERFLRLPFCALTPDEIHEGIHRLAQAVEAVKAPALPKSNTPGSSEKRMDLSDTVRLLGDLLGQVVSAEETPQLFETEEKIRALAKARRSGEASAGARLAAEVATLMPNAARSVASAGGFGRSRRIAFVTIAKVPSDPTMRLVMS